MTLNWPKGNTRQRRSRKWRKMCRYLKRVPKPVDVWTVPVGEEELIEVLVRFKANTKFDD